MVIDHSDSAMCDNDAVIDDRDAEVIDAVKTFKNLFLVLGGRALSPIKAPQAFWPRRGNLPPSPTNSP